MNLISYFLSNILKHYQKNFKTLNNELRIKMPNEVWIEILSKLPFRSLGNLSIVDRYFNLMSRERILWKHLCLAEGIQVNHDPMYEYLAFKKIEKLYDYSPFMQLVAKTIGAIRFNQINHIDSFNDTLHEPYVEKITSKYAFTFAFKCCDNNTRKVYTVKIMERPFSRSKTILDRHQIPFTIIVDRQKKKKFLDEEGLRLIYHAAQGIFLKEMT